MSATFELYTPEGATEAVEFIRVVFAPAAPGSVCDVMFRPATDEDKDKYSGPYREFKAAKAPKAEAPKPTPKAADEPPKDFMPGFADTPKEPEKLVHYKPHPKKG